MLLALAPAAFAQSSFNFADFSNVSTLALNGSSVQVGNALRLTDFAVNQTGCTWHRVEQGVVAGFDTQFDFTITAGGVLAEGMAFVVQLHPTGSSTIGGGVWGLGYGGGSNGRAITNSIAVEIDTFRDNFVGDTSDNELSIHTRGTAGNTENESASIARLTPRIRMSDGQQHTLRILYVPGTLEVFLDDLTTPLLSVPYDFGTGGNLLTGPAVGGLNLPNGSAFVGFTATTGANNLNERVDIHRWSWSSSAGVDGCYEGTVGVAAGGSPTDVLAINGSTGGFFRTVEVSAFDPFSIDVSTPAGVMNAPFVLFATLGIPDGSMPLVLPNGDRFCFRNLAPLRFGVGPAPVSIPIPTGLPFVTALTFQGVLLEDPTNPNAVAITNAVALDLVAPPMPTVRAVQPLSAAVGGSITVSGEGFSPAARVDAGGVAVTPTQVTPTQLTFNYPTGVPCDATLTVTNPDGQNATGMINPTPSVRSTINPTGPAAGGTRLIVLGTGFAPGTTATVGGAPATIVSASSAAVLLDTPPGSVGVANVVLTTPGGCSVTTTFTYN